MFRRRRSQRKNNRIYHLDDPSQIRLVQTSVQGHNTQEDITANVYAAGVYHFQRRDELLALWRSLSLREQDVVAYTCLGFKNRYIAARMGISQETVKSYLRNIFNKLRVNSKADIRVLFADLGFEAWNKPYP
jgi:DNA-binding CsgD family transcriptional regulator